MVKKVGFIVNPVAGMGGKVGLKGSDGQDIYRQALALGAVAEAPRKAAVALSRLAAVKDRLQIITYRGAMGEDAARLCGFTPWVIGAAEAESSTSLDTRRAAAQMRELGASLILFAGGDGTARDVFRSVADKTVVLGIPAGVKMHSAVFAVNPRSAGDLAAAYLTGRVTATKEAEVMDIDEQAYRQERLGAKLYGYLRIPYERASVQGLKCSGVQHEQAALALTAAYFLDSMDENWYYLIGPGTTTRAIMEQLNLPNTLLGVDVVHRGQLIAADANEQQLLGLLTGKKAKIVVSPIGGQGYIFGRGNQQISAAVIKKVGRDNIIVIATKDKLVTLPDRVLYADTGDRDVNSILKGYYRVITGYQEEVVCKCIA